MGRGGVARLVAMMLGVSACGGATPSIQRVEYPDGKPHWEYATRAGVPHGQARVWHENGNLKTEGEYRDGVKHGRFRFFAASGAFDYQVLFFQNVEVWRSADVAADPPPELIKGLVALAGPDPRPAPATRFSPVPVPAPYFASMDRTTSLQRVGAQAGFGGGGNLPFGSVRRVDVFGNYKFSSFGAYGQFSQAFVESTPGMSISGKQTLELGGTYHHPVRGNELSSRLGVLFPVSGDDVDGFVAGTAGAFQRPTDAATSFPATVGVRTGASLTRASDHFVLQADGGIDWLLGGGENAAALDPLLRANFGVGFGARATLFTVEISNTIRLSEPSNRIHAFAFGGTIWYRQLWLTPSLSLTFEGHAAITASVGYEL